MARKAIVIGAGITGIATAWALSEKGYSVTLLEKNAQLGGFAASFKHKNYILDYGPHKIYSTLPGIMNKYKEILGDDCLVVKKKNSLRLLGKYLSFPPKIGQMAMDIPKMAILRCGLSFSYSLAQNTLTKKKVISYEDYFLKGFGMQAYKLLFEQYAWKVWGDPKTLSEELARKRTPVPSIFHLAKNVIFGTKDKPEVSADIFYYPKYGIGQVCDKLVDSIKRNGGTIKTEVDIIAINKEGDKIKSVTYQDKQGKHEEKADFVVSTI
ncbi:FAD-dependent oxidoreductase, partial [Candidatus Woesearchaeota archaeon]|nr:FAD-dependent oxidoreductase [Candidatus Woesearchaeota archaeon]